MYTRVFCYLMCLLGLTGVVTARFGRCDYEQAIEVGRPYYVFSPGYPNKKYRPGTICRWTAKSDRPINMTCDFTVPKSNRCIMDGVVIKSPGTRGRSYCGTGFFTIVSKGNQFNFKLYSSRKSPGGRFFCKLRAVTSISDETCTCGMEKSKRIVGGKETAINQFTMMAALLNHKKDLVFCGATIINPKQVLTAGHCVHGMNYRIIGVVVGDHDTKKDDETEATRVLPANGFIIHPRYTSDPSDYDIAIVTVEEEIEFNKFVGPVCLPFQHSHDSFAGSYVEKLGWGSTEFGGKQSDTLQVVRMHILSNKKCIRSRPEITKRHMCTLERDKDSCSSDSGGPVLWMDPTTRNRVLIAIISYGVGCASNTPSVNTRVGAFIDWILLQAPAGFKYCEAE